MYKVFVNGMPLIFADAVSREAVDPTFFTVSLGPSSILPLVQEGMEQGDLSFGEVYILSDAPEASFEAYCKLFDIEVAAGGCVLNPDGKVLAIERPSHGIGWDLPKGKAEGDETMLETAIREIQEECNAGDLVMKRELLTTYHTFFRGERRVLKRCHWFLFTSEQFTPQAQTDEGISKAEWVSKKELKDHLAFPVLMDVLKEAGV
ncbi:MAG: NUDIX domain-containing protein [Flavobacteriales bacterium]|nr:NUDIX domain-containing protein [Flavobacteriales bacterium]